MRDGDVNASGVPDRSFRDHRLIVDVGMDPAQRRSRAVPSRRDARSLRLQLRTAFTRRQLPVIYGGMSAPRR